MKNWLVRLLKLLLARLEPSPEPLVTFVDKLVEVERVVYQPKEYDLNELLSEVCGHFSDNLVNRARELVSGVDSVPHSGEYKRHQVYAQLLKEFPDVAKHQVSFVIELVISQEKR